MSQLNDCDPRHKPTQAELRRKSFRKIGADIIEWNGEFFKIVRIASGAVMGSNNRYLKRLELELLEQPVSD